MKILVFSDTHGNPGCMLDAVRAHVTAGPVARIVHLGDGYRDFTLIREKYPDIPMTQVAGNGEDAVRCASADPVFRNLHRGWDHLFRDARTPFAGKKRSGKRRECRCA